MPGPTVTSERRRPRNASLAPQAKEHNEFEKAIEEGLEEEERKRAIRSHAKRLATCTGLDMEQALRIAANQVGCKVARHGRRGSSLGDRPSASERAREGSPWEKRGVRPVNHQEKQVDPREVRRIHQKFAADTRDATHYRGRRRGAGRAGTAPDTAGSAVTRAEHIHGAEEELEGGRYPVKPTMEILALVDVGQDDLESDDEDGNNPAQESARQPYSATVSRASMRAEESKLIHHAYLTAKQHQASARAALAKVPDEVLSGESHFDLHSFMCGTADH